ncbi:uncharacterized protein LOC126890468 [Diabrotica virgifera virgifera]|uniref:E3 ubiquitin-protein ligase n=1 Tax=Diabrotica virgifera virgifera TaxID=50390 RepID=A0ABM5KYX3_DIAVI|nr:uncharacterized protein LOC126890468 [Diabrotica virgifera virgifera]
MAFSFPDDFLEKYTCNECNKFLSVKPIKLYENQVTKCGRCTKWGDKGTISSFGMLANQGIFKCVNRLDGCRKFLLTTQVPLHEEECISKSYNCPLCHGTNEPLFTFELISHFNKCHPDCVLKANVFEVSTMTPMIMLYRKNDFVFFVCSKIENDSHLFVQTYLVGDDSIAESIQQQYSIKSEIGKVQTPMRKCQAYSFEQIQSFILKEKGLEILGKTWINIEINISRLPCFYQLPSLEDQEEHRTIGRYEYFAEQCWRIGINWPNRLVLLDGDGNISLSEDSTYIIKNLTDGTKLKVFITCFNCFRIADKNLLILINSSFFGICDICSKINKTLHYTTSLIDVLCTNLRFVHIDQYLRCPEENCKYRNNLLQLQNHMKRKHKRDISLSNYFSLSFLREKAGILDMYAFVLPYILTVRFKSYVKQSTKYWKIKVLSKSMAPGLKPRCVILNNQVPNYPIVQEIFCCSDYMWYSNDYLYVYLSCTL